MVNFYDKCARAIEGHIDFGKIKVLVIASPGFVKDGFVNYMEERKADIPWYDRNKVYLAHCSSGTKQAISEMLSD
jgi:protein pelota